MKSENVDSNIWEQKDKRISNMNAMTNATNFVTSCIQSGVFKPKNLVEGFDKIKEYMIEIFHLTYDLEVKKIVKDESRICERCARKGKDTKITQGIAEFSMKTYGEQLCFDCQKEVKKRD